MAITRKVTKTINPDEGSVTFEFATGEVEELKLSDFPEEVQRMLALHGLSQKIGDSWAGEAAQNAYTIYQVARDNLLEGKWSTRTASSGPRISQLAEAVSRVMGISVEDAVKKLAELDDETRKAVKSDPRIKKAILEIKLEKEAQAAAEAADSPLL